MTIGAIITCDERVMDSRNLTPFLAQNIALTRGVQSARFEQLNPAACLIIVINIIVSIIQFSVGSTWVRVSKFNREAAAVSRRKSHTQPIG